MPGSVTATRFSTYTGFAIRVLKDATQIVDFYHGLEHAGQALEALLCSKDHPE